MWNVRVLKLLKLIYILKLNRKIKQKPNKNAETQQLKF